VAPGHSAIAIEGLQYLDFNRLQRREHLGFAAEVRLQVGIGGGRISIAIQSDVAGFVQLTEPAST
jgi:hypothetical protein